MSNTPRPRQRRSEPISSSSESNSSSELSENDSDSENVEGGEDKQGDACDHCGKICHKKLTLKTQTFCSVVCLRKSAKASASNESRGTKRTASEAAQTSSTTSSNITSEIPKKAAVDGSKSFDWKTYLIRPDFSAAPVSCFKHVALSYSWDSVCTGLKVEVQNTDSKCYGGILPTFYWIASIVKNCGFMALLRYEGFEAKDESDFWVNMCTDDIHTVGWCSTEGKPLIPPKIIEERFDDWKQFLVKRLTGSNTLPSDFTIEVSKSLENTIQKNMRLEVVDKNRISSVRVATVSEVTGGRLHVTYEGCEDKNGNFWCHERSPLIHPVGWAQVVGHDLKATAEYAKESLQKTLFRKFDKMDATWDMFLPVVNPVTDLKFKVGMKLEAIDPLNLSTICVATVTKVLRNNYLMIGIDGMMAANGSDWFCYHASSPCIFPVGFCTANDIKLTPPRGYKGEFKWEEYLKQNKAIAAPEGLFKKTIPNHGFEEGMHLEAVDLMEPGLICVGSVTKVVGRLLRIHFDGWENAYDQWCDCESPDLFPLGWCQVVGYRLEPPRTENTEDSVILKKKKKFHVYKGQRRKKRSGMQGRKMLHRTSSQVSQSLQDEPKDESDGNSSSDNAASKSRDNSNSSEVLPETSDKKLISAESIPKSSSPSVSGVAFRSPLSETDPRHWSVADVAQFLRINECGSYSQMFSQEKVDGVKLLTLTKESLMSMTGMKVGPSLKISHLIQQLKSSRK